MPRHVGTAVADGVVWSASEAEMTLYAVDLESNRVLHATRLPEGEPKWVEPWEGTIWVVVDGAESGVVRVDPATGDVLSTISLAGKRPHSVAVGFGSLWVTDHGSPTLYRFSADGTLQAKIDGPGWNVAIASTADAIWAAASKSVLRVDPTTNTVTGEIPVGVGDWYALASAGGYLWLTSGEAGRLLQMPVPAP